MDKFSKYSTSRMQLLPTSLLISLFAVLYDHPFYLVCPDVLSLVGELLSGDRCGSSNHIWFWLFFLLIMLFIPFILDIKNRAVIQLKT